MDRYGLLGHNISYSRSPEIWEKIWKAEAVTASYELIDTDDPKAFIERVRSTPSWRGFSVTTPYKEWIIPHLDELTDVAIGVGAVNAVKVAEGCLIGHNTDVEGFLSPLPQGLRRALILGSGGAAKAVRYALESIGIETWVVSRSAERGDLTYEKVTPQRLKEIDMIVNATPLGSAKYPDTPPPIPYRYLTSQHLLYDLSYTEGTAFLTSAPSQCPKLDGKEMLLQQAVAAYRFFTHQPKR